MLNLVRSCLAHRRQVELERLMKLAAQADQVLMTEQLRPDTRRLLTAQRQQLEERIRALKTQGATPLYWPYAPLTCPDAAGQCLGRKVASPGPGLPPLLPGVRAVLAAGDHARGATRR